MSLPHQLSHDTLTTIRDRFGMTEIGAPYRTLSSPFGPVGSVRVFAGAAVAKMVYIGLTVAQFGLDSHMIFAFTPPDSPVPHFTLDSVLNAPDFAFHLDLIPRLDMGAHLAYMDTCFTPLTEAFDAAAQIEGLKPARLGPRQYAIMSPWMLAYRANETAFEAIRGPVDAYLAHWAGLVEAGLPAQAYEGWSAEQLADRDRRNRSIIFNPAVDKVWAQVDRLLGPQTSADLRDILISQSVEAL
jgi:hypothetical protein